jgi:hypothetical protein
MATIDSFLAEIVSDFRRRLALLGNDGDRRAIEDGIALLTDYRLSDMDARGFESLLSTLRGGRSPVGLAVLRPEALASELARRWREYGERETSAVAARARGSLGIVGLTLREVG